MIDHARLASLRGRLAELRSSYVRSGEDVRNLATEIERERAMLVAAVAGRIVRDRKRFNPHLPKITPEQVALDPDVVVMAQDEDELSKSGVRPEYIKALRARELVLSRRRKQHEELGARVRVWAAYMAGVEALASEMGA